MTPYIYDMRMEAQPPFGTTSNYPVTSAKTATGLANGDVMIVHGCQTRTGTLTVCYAIIDPKNDQTTAAGIVTQPSARGSLASVALKATATTINLAVMPGRGPVGLRNARCMSRIVSVQCANSSLATDIITVAERRARFGFPRHCGAVGPRVRRASTATCDRRTRDFAHVRERRTVNASANAVASLTTRCVIRVHRFNGSRIRSDCPLAQRLASIQLLLQSNGAASACAKCRLSRRTLRNAAGAVRATRSTGRKAQPPPENIYQRQNANRSSFNS